MPRISVGMGIFNVKENFGDLGGAKGDGVTDDRAAIQAAYTACLAAKGTLYFPNGDYLVKQLGVSSYALNFNGALVNVEGVGHGSRILGDGGDYRLLIVTAGGGSTQRIRIQGLYFDGGSVGAFAAENNNTGIHIQKCSVECKITDCTFENLNEDGIYLGGDATNVMADIVVSHNVFRNIGRTAVALISANKFNVSDNILEDIDYQGIDVEPDVNTYSAVNGVIANNVIGNSGNSVYPVSRAAIGIIHQTGSAEAVTGKITVSGNTTSAFGTTATQAAYAIFVYRTHSVTVVGNTVDGIRNNGIHVGTSNNVTICGNTCTRQVASAGAGIYLDTATHCDVTGNHCSSGGGNGIKIVDTTSPSNTVVGNHCYSNGEVGIYCGSPSNLINSNHVIGSGIHGIWVVASDCEVVGNRCEGNGQQVDNFYDNICITGSYNTVQANRCKQGALTNQPKYGIDVTAGTANQVTNNNLHDAGQTGNLNDAGTGTITAAGNYTT